MSEPAAAPVVHKRHLRNYLLDSRYQLKFTGIMVAIALLLTAGLTTGLGYMILSKAHEASRMLDVRMADPDDLLAQQLAAQFAANDRILVYTLVGFGVVLGLLLTVFLTIFGIIMSHKVAGPLYKVSSYLDRMAGGKLGQVYNLRKGDELVEFFGHFKGAHDALRAQAQADVVLLGKAAEAVASGPLADELRAAKKQKEDSLA